MRNWIVVMLWILSLLLLFEKTFGEWTKYKNCSIGTSDRQNRSKLLVALPYHTHTHTFVVFFWYSKPPFRHIYVFERSADKITDVLAQDGHFIMEHRVSVFICIPASSMWSGKFIQFFVESKTLHFPFLCNAPICHNQSQMQWVDFNTRYLNIILMR